MKLNLFKMSSMGKVFAVTLATSIGLIVAGFIVPPTGVVDGSVLTAVGELLAFAALWEVPTLVKAGKTAKLQAGEMSLTIGDKEDIDNNNTEEPHE